MQAMVRSQKPSTPASALSSATELLRNDILLGFVVPGERLVEATLSDRYGVGRAAIRAAFVELDGEGLVSREENRGATVRRISVGEAIEITEARAALEGLIARRAADTATKTEKAALKALIAAMTKAVKSNELLEYGNLNRQLHESFRQIARHRVADDLVANLRNRAAHHQFRLATVNGRAAESLPQHRAIVAAIAASDGDAAEVAMRAHLGSVIEVLKRWEQLGVVL
jgi:DNA-binding GntR family transcriptional regulator